MFHTNPQTGDTSTCSAVKGRCPFGSPAEHFKTKKDAREAYEATQANLPAPVAKPAVMKIPASDPADDELWARMGGRRIFNGEIKELLTAPGDDVWSVVALKDGTFINRHSVDALYRRGRLGDNAELYRKELVDEAAENNPIAYVTNGEFPVDEARDYLATHPIAEVREVAEAAFASTLALSNPELRDSIYSAAESRGGEIRGAILNEYVDYADLVEEIRSPESAASMEPRTDEGRAVAGAKSPVSYAFSVFRGRGEIDQETARDVLEQAFPVSINGLSETARIKAFTMAHQRSDTWNSLVEEYHTIAEVAAFAKEAPKRYSASLPPRNVAEAEKYINTKSKAKNFLKDSEMFYSKRGENVQATVDEITEMLKEREEFSELFQR